MKLQSVHRRTAWLTICSLLCLSACGAVDDTDPQPIEVQVQDEQAAIVPTWEEYREAATIRDADRPYFVVESDLYFETAESLRAHYDDLVTREKSKLAVFRRISDGYEPVFVGSKARDIVYCTSNAFTSKATANADIKAAIRDWESVIDVRFRYDSSQDANCTDTNANVDFAFMPITNSTSLLGCGINKMSWLPPNDGCPQGGVAGSTSVKGVVQANYGAYPFSGSFAAVTMVGNLRHELGHLLGFRHEHPWAPNQGGCGEAPSIASLDTTGRRLTAYDQTSVMHYPQCAGLTGVDQTISGLDGEGARSIYGMPVSWYEIFL